MDQEIIISFYLYDPHENCNGHKNSMILSEFKFHGACMSLSKVILETCAYI